MSGRVWATAGFALGIGASVAGNVAHAQPTIGAQLAAAFYPLALLLTVEILSRVAWPSGLGWSVVRFGGAGLVAMVAAVVSYSHLHGLLVGYGEEPVTAVLGPLSVDGLMVTAGFALLAVGVDHKTVMADIKKAESTGECSPVQPERVRSLDGNHGSDVAKMVATPGPAPVAIEGPQVSGQDASTIVDTGLPVTADDGSEQLVIADVPDGDPALAGLVATAQDHFAEVLATGRLPSVRSIRRELRLGHPRAARVRAALQPPGTAR